MSNPVLDTLIKDIESRQKKVVAEKPEVSEQKHSLFNERKESKKKQKQLEYKDIIGESHPDGNKYYFQSFEAEDWPVVIRDMIPEDNENFVLPNHDLNLALLDALDNPGRNLLMVGPPGAGKSEIVPVLCARLGRPFLFISGMAGIEPMDIIGCEKLIGGESKYVYGKLAIAVKNGAVCLYDEPFKSAPAVNMCIQSLLDGRRTLQLYGSVDSGELELQAHPEFRMVLADNVRGTGDGIGDYAAEVQDKSMLNRMFYRKYVDYLHQKAEEKLLRNVFPDITGLFCTKSVQLANLIRKAWRQEEVEMPYSPRDLMAFVGRSLETHDPAAAFKDTYYDILTEQEKAVVKQFWKDVDFYAHTL